MHITKSIFSIWSSTGDRKFRKLLIHLILTLYAALQFSVCLKAIIAPISLSPPPTPLLDEPTLF